MPWETRKGKGRYYTRTRRVNGRVVREYLGNGEAAEQAAAADEKRRQELAQETIQQEIERAKWQQIEQIIDQQHRLVMALFEADMKVNGYRYHRGEWRKRRVPLDFGPATEVEHIASTAKQPPATGSQPASRPRPQRREFTWHGGFVRGKIASPNREQLATAAPRQACYGRYRALRADADSVLAPLFGEQAEERSSSGHAAGGGVRQRASAEQGCGARPPPVS